MLKFLNYSFEIKDLHGPTWENFTGHHTALYARADEFDENQIVLNVHFAIKHWINKGTPRNKINLGLATYGRTYKLVSNQTELGSPAFGPGSPGKVSFFPTILVLRLK